MKIDPAIVARHWEQAALEQLSSQLQSEGYSVEREIPFGNARADLVARKPDGSFTVIEVKTPGDRRNPDAWTQQVSALREHTRALGGRFRLVIVRPPRATVVEIDGLEDALREALVENMPQELQGLSSDTSIDDVSSVDVSAISVRAGDVEIAGEGTLTATLHADDEDPVAQESFPFTFRAKLDRANRISELEEVQVDLSSWYCEDETG